MSCFSLIDIKSFGLPDIILCIKPVTNGNIAAIDFGTTSVSLAYTTKGDDKVNNLVLEMDKSNELTRVPNAILLKKEESNKITVAAFGSNATRRFTLTRKNQYSDYIYFGRIKNLMREKVFYFILSIFIKVFAECQQTDTS